MNNPLNIESLRGSVRWIIGATFVILILEMVFPGIVGVLGLVPARITHNFWFWQPFTYLFLHGGFVHWLFNMLMLWMFGQQLESRWGTRYFLFYFVTCGVAAALCVWAINPNSAAVTIGASGSVLGLLVGFAMMFPDAVMLFMFIFPMRVWQAVVLIALIELFAGIESRNMVVRFAHLGGMAGGYLLLKSQDSLNFRLWHPWETIGRWWSRRKAPSHRSRVELHEVTDDLVKEVDRILEKILKKGVDSLTPKEKELMERYSKLKH
jgi:membrane associated rhomboid family serine protease